MGSLKKLAVLLLIGANVYAAKVGSTTVENGPTANEVFQAKVESLMKQQIAQRVNRSPNEFEVSIDQLNLIPAPRVGEKNFEVLSILGLGSQGSQRLDGLFAVDAVIKSSAGIQDKKISGLLKVVGPAVVARKIINSGKTIDANDVEELRVPWKNFPAGAGFTPINEIIGRQMKVYVPAGGFVYSGILENQESIRAGDWVNLTLLSASGVMIRSKAISKQQGGVGDSIRVENPDTKKILTGVITGKQEVEVQL